MSVNILTVNALKSAIRGAAKKFATQAEFVHEMAYNCILHVETFADPCHLNSFYAAAPTDTKKRIRVYATVFGKVSFDSASMLFKFSSKKASDLPTALITSPSEYEKAAKSHAPANENAETGETGAAAPASSKPAKDVVLDTLQTALKALEKHQDSGGFVDPRIMANINGAVRLALGKVAAIAPVAKLVKKSAPESEKIAA